MRYLEQYKTPGTWGGFGQINADEPESTFFLNQWPTKEDSLEGIKEYVHSGFYDLVWIEDPRGKRLRSSRPTPKDLEKGLASVVHYMISGDN